MVDFTRQRLVSIAAVLLVVGAGFQVGCDSNATSEDSFVVLLDASPKGLDPRFATSDGSAKLVGLLHAGLVSVDTASGEPQLELAESIDQISPLRYEVTLRDDIYFHDGQKVTSADVEYTFMKLDSELVQSPYAGSQRRIETFDVVDERHLNITLKQPYAPFLNDLSMGVVPKHICAGHSECPGQPIGAGPFAFAKQEAFELFVFESFDKYFGGQPPIDRLAFKVVEDDNTRLLGLLGKSADLVQNAVAPLMLPVVHESDRLVVETAPSFKYTYIAFNLEHPILDDAKVRRAIAHGIDRKAIIKYKFRGHARLSTGMLAPDHWAYEPDVARYNYDVEAAKRLLDDAGYPDPDGDGPKLRFEIEFKVSASKFRQSLAGLIAHQLERVGIGVTVRSYEWGTFFYDVKSRNFAMTTLQWPSVLDPSLYSWIFHSKNIPSPQNRSAGANRGAYDNERMDELLERGERETDATKRKAIYSEVQQILARDLPYVSLWHEDNIAIMSDQVHDYYMTPNARFEGLKVTRTANRANEAKMNEGPGDE
jgi:peptide/nickel transport system substrate-binding protein